MRRVLWLGAVVLGLSGCGKKQDKPEAGAAATAIDCGAVGTKMKKCGDAFWAAYANTGLARNNAATPEAMAGNVNLLRTLTESTGGAQFCENMVSNYGKALDNPKFHAAVNGCMATEACDAWAACAAPALTNEKK